jgi:hypothetical protein
MVREGMVGVAADLLAILWETEALTDEQFIAALDRLDSIPPTNMLGQKAAEIEAKVRTQ